MSDTPSPGIPQWEIGPTLAQAWELFKANAGILIGGSVVIAVASGVFSGISQGVQVAAQQVGEDTAMVAAGLVSFVVGLLSWAVQTFLTLGYVRMMLHLVRGEPAAFGDLFSATPVIVAGLVASLLTGLATLAGTCLLVVPGVIVALGLLFANWVIVDQGLGPVEALKASWRLTSGEKGRLFLWALVVVGLAIVGGLACCVGLLVALPVAGLGTTIVYDHLARLKPRVG